MTSGRAVSFSVLNQAVTSLTNLGVGVYLARALEPHEFGLYGIGFALILFFCALGNATLITQMVVLRESKRDSDISGYDFRMLLALIAICGATMAVVVSILWGISASSVVGGRYFGFGLAVGATAIACLLKDYFVRLAYSRKAEGSALAINCLVAIGTALGYAMWPFLSLEWSARTALTILALANAGSLLFGWRSAKFSVSECSLSKILPDLQEAWVGGRWASLTATVYSVRAQAHTIVVAAVIGPSGLAVLNASRLFVTPVIMLIPAASQVVLPKMAAARARGGVSVEAISAIFSTSLLLFLAFYGLFLLIGLGFIESVVFAGRYESMRGFIFGWLAFAAVLIFRNAKELSLQAQLGFKGQAIANGISAILTLGGVYLSVRAFGEIGSLLGLVAGEISLYILLAAALKNVKTQR